MHAAAVIVYIKHVQDPTQLNSWDCLSPSIAAVCEVTYHKQHQSSCCIAKTTMTLNDSEKYFYTVNDSERVSPLGRVSPLDPKVVYTE